MHSGSKVLLAPVYQLSSEKWSNQYTSLAAVLNPLYNSTNQQLFEKNLCYQSSHYVIMHNFCYKWRPSCAFHKINTFRDEQRWIGHKGGHW